MGVGPYPCVVAAEDVESNWANLPVTKTDVCVYSVQLAAGCVLGVSGQGNGASLKEQKGSGLLTHLRHPSWVPDIAAPHVGPH